MPKEPELKQNGNGNGKLSGLQSFLNFTGGIGGVLAISLVLWRGGAIERQVNINTDRLFRLENTGSPALIAHIQSDDQRVSDLAKRMSSYEATLQQYIDLKVELKGVSTRLDGIKEAVEKLADKVDKNRTFTP